MGTLLLKDCVSRFIAWAKLRFAPGTVSFYQIYLDRFSAEFAGRTIGSITRLDVETWSASRNPLVSVKRFFRWAHCHGELIATNPCQAIKVPAVRRRSRTLERSERVQLRRRSSPALRAFLLAVEESGGRPHEWRGAVWENVHLGGGGVWTWADLEAGKCLLRLNAYKGQQRRDNPYVPRIIPISARLGRLLSRLGRKLELLTGAILRASRGEAWTPNGLRCSFRRVRAGFEGGRNKAHERVVIYSYRHTKATDLARKGVNGRILADFLGHASLDLLGWYVHPTEADMSKLVEREKRPMPRKPGGDDGPRAAGRDDMAG